MTRLFPIAAAIAISSAASLATAGGAVFAEKAPNLDNVEWIQGDPVTTFKKDHVYVLDFWATWCGPCVASIPHLNELAKQHKGDVTFIGLAVWPRDSMTPTDEFVEEQGDAMGYTIAADIDGNIAKTYMKSLNKNGIPTAMIIDKAGRLAWIGHPMYPEGAMDNAIAQILEGSYDFESVKSEYAKEWEASRGEREKQAKASELMSEIRNEMKAKNYEAAIKNIDAAYDWNADMFANALLTKYNILLTKLDQPKKAASLGNKLVNDTFADNAQMLNGIAWEIATEYPEDNRDMALALSAAERADKLTKSSDPSIMDTLARVYFVNGDTDKAIALQKKAVTLAEQINPQFADQLREALTEYTTAKASM